jgi:hypothetical protein
MFAYTDITILLLCTTSAKVPAQQQLSNSEEVQDVSWITNRDTSLSPLNP